MRLRQKPCDECKAPAERGYFGGAARCFLHRLEREPHDLRGDRLVLPSRRKVARVPGFRPRSSALVLVQVHGGRWVQDAEVTTENIVAAVAMLYESVVKAMTGQDEAPSRHGEVTVSVHEHNGDAVIYKAEDRDSLIRLVSELHTGV